MSFFRCSPLCRLYQSDALRVLEYLPPQGMDVAVTLDEIPRFPGCLQRPGADKRPADQWPYRVDLAALGRLIAERAGQVHAFHCSARWQPVFFQLVFLGVIPQADDLAPGSGQQVGTALTAADAVAVYAVV